MVVLGASCLPVLTVKAHLLVDSTTYCDFMEMQVTGVITLEDILEEVIKAEIIDEHDTFVANDSMQKVHKVRALSL